MNLHEFQAKWPSLRPLFGLSFMNIPTFFHKIWISIFLHKNAKAGIHFLVPHPVLSKTSCHSSLPSPHYPATLLPNLCVNCRDRSGILPSYWAPPSYGHLAEDRQYVHKFPRFSTKTIWHERWSLAAILLWCSRPIGLGFILLVLFLGHFQRPDVFWPQIVSNLVCLRRATDTKEALASPLTIWVGRRPSGPTHLGSCRVLQSCTLFLKAIQYEIKQNMYQINTNIFVDLQNNTTKFNLIT
jgi:hypothetical protein